MTEKQQQKQTSRFLRSHPNPKQKQQLVDLTTAWKRRASHGHHDNHSHLRHPVTMATAHHLLLRSPAPRVSETARQHKRVAAAGAALPTACLAPPSPPPAWRRLPVALPAACLAPPLISDPAGPGRRWGGGDGPVRMTDRSRKWVRSVKVKGAWSSLHGRHAEGCVRRVCMLKGVPLTNISVRAGRLEVAPAP